MSRATGRKPVCRGSLEALPSPGSSDEQNAEDTNHEIRPEQRQGLGAGGEEGVGGRGCKTPCNWELSSAH